ncbi:leucine-rich_repeat domain-containing protein [Hexamita inflata]|uniref:Leucine-rich repeat domain-containing protein n=1 Tax=Hexamita inflata TaxID=28002 RepID=A0AA86PS04_9EUKA|nr:leucine-rich repeat domain-containing protein [Hexamita inflata]
MLNTNQFTVFRSKLNSLDNIVFYRGNTSAVQSVDMIWLSHCYISDVSDLSIFVYCRQLTLSYNSIQNLFPLAALHLLTHLELDFNQISDPSPLSILFNLEFLHLASNQIQCLDFLESLTNIHWLSLVRNQISCLNPLRKLNKLVNLFIQQNRIANFQELFNINQEQLMFVCVCNYEDEWHNPICYEGFYREKSLKIIQSEYFDFYQEKLKVNIQDRISSDKLCWNVYENQ